VSAARERGLLKMGELAERSGVSAGTIKHYLREGLLPEPVRTSRNMAYYPPHFVERIRLIKRLQEDRFLPLRVIRGIVAQDPGRAAALLEERGRERALSVPPAGRVPAAELARRHDVPPSVLARLAELGVLSPTAEGYEPDDVRIVAAISGLFERLAGEDEIERAAQMAAASAEPLGELLVAMRSKLLAAEIERPPRGRPAGG
jgi:DNA-binding transcriptional MerR regulator